MFQRRDVIKGILALSSFTLLPACKQLGLGGSSEFLSGDKFLSQEELDFLTALSDAIIPSTDTPGAVAAKVPLTLQNLLSEWANDETRGNWRMVLTGIKETLDKTSAGMFETATIETRAKSITALDAEVYKDEKHKLAAYRDVKKTIADAYYTSEIGAKVELHYENSPGQWVSDVPLSKIGKTWAV